MSKIESDTFDTHVLPPTQTSPMAQLEPGATCVAALQSPSDATIPGGHWHVPSTQIASPEEI